MFGRYFLPYHHSGALETIILNDGGLFSLLFVNVKRNAICERKLFYLSDLPSCRKMLTEVIGVRTGKYSLGERNT